jgi:hypothetical protein
MSIQHADLKFVCFFPWLAGRLHNFELTQTEKKQEMALYWFFSA